MSNARHTDVVRLEMSERGDVVVVVQAGPYRRYRLALGVLHRRGNLHQQPGLG
jgi:hypothetical protein